jgi:hypothetical protein
MKLRAVLLLASILLVQGSALAQPRPERERNLERQGFAARERAREDRRDARRERMQRQGHRFTPQEREKLRQDLIDANREMHRKK